jgi:putative flippase GtrA
VRRKNGSALISTNFQNIARVFFHLPAYFVIGLLTGLVNILVFWVGINIIDSIYIATLAGNVASIFVNFGGLRKIFAAKFAISIVVKYATSLVIYYFLSVGLTLAIFGIGVAEVISRGLTICILFPLGYIANKYLIFS